MFGLENIHQTHLPNDIIRSYLNLYSLIGRNDDFLSTLNEDLPLFIEATIREDVYALLQDLDIQIPEQRLKQLLLKDIQPRNRNETLCVRLKTIFRKMHSEIDDFELILYEITSLAQMLYQDIGPNDDWQYAKVIRTPSKDKKEINLLTSSFASKRDYLEQLIVLYHKAIDKHQFEKGYAATHFYLDFIALKPFNKHNETLALLVLYLLLLASDYRSFHLDAFFLALFAQKQAFLKARQEAYVNYSEGVSTAIPLHRFLLDITTKSYQAAQHMIRNYTYDHQHNKSDYLENTILRLNDVFTKEDIRLKHPTVSDSTINRTLKRLRDEDKIRPLGTGRSAKWMKVPQKPQKTEQITFKF